MRRIECREDRIGREVGAIVLVNLVERPHECVDVHMPQRESVGLEFLTSGRGGSERRGQ